MYSGDSSVVGLMVMCGDVIFLLCPRAYTQKALVNYSQVNRNETFPRSCFICEDDNIVKFFPSLPKQLKDVLWSEMHSRCRNVPSLHKQLKDVLWSEMHSRCKNVPSLHKQRKDVLWSEMHTRRVCQI